jgi:hypothetical protein
VDIPTVPGIQVRGVPYGTTPFLMGQ